MTDAPDIVYIVHGSNAHTWWRRLANGGYPWWRRWSLFSCEVRRTFGRACEIREFRWSGHNTHEARMNAGADLARAIERDRGRKIHLIGHSHGGNVALAAVNHLAPYRVESVIVLANPNMALLDGTGAAPEWLYWGETPERVSRIWNLHSPQDIVQCGLVRLFHGVPRSSGKNRSSKQVLVRSTYGGPGHQLIRNGEIHWKRTLTAHRALHSGAMGAVAGSLLRGTEFPEAMSDAGLSANTTNDVHDRGGWPGLKRTEEMIRNLGDPGPFDFGNSAGNVGILFVHGFTASPAELRPMAQFMAQAAGWRCKGILLPGHGTRVEDMQRTNGEDWVAYAEQAYEELSRQCRHVFLAGLSLGAVIACHIALRRAGDSKMRGLLLLAPAFGVTPIRAAGIRLLRPIHNLRGKGTRASDYFLDHRLYTYLQIPLNRAAEVMKLGRDAVQRMGALRDVPVMMFTGDRESTVSLQKMLTVARENPWIRLVRLPRSRHILTVEPDREIVFEASVRFVEECLGKADLLLPPPAPS